MNVLRPLCSALLLFAIAPALAVEAPATMLVIHGGAGLQREGTSEADEAALRAAITLALRTGHAELAAGKPALDAVTAAITVLEDNPLFNAGKGAVFTHDGRNELDASLMDGATRKAGAVAGVHNVKNPILLAREVMQHSPHVMMAGAGAEAFAQERGVEQVDPAYFRTERRWQQLQRALEEDATGQARAAPRSEGRGAGKENVGAGRYRVELAT